MKRALVLSGGGAKGAYQVGVYKALLDLKIKIDIITGSSIGSINGALFTEGKYLLTKKMWLKLNNKEIFGTDVKDDQIINYYSNIIKIIFKEKGLSFDKAKILFEKYIDEDRIRKSKINYGLVTFSLKNFKPRILTKDQIPKGKLIDYIIASSACYPAIQKQEINEDVLIDGGFYDNLPINLAIDMGATEIIAVDLGALGLKKKVTDKNIKIDLIKSKDKRLFTLSFNPDYARTNIHMGYNDTMKYYKELDGSVYTFRKNEIDKIYNEIEKYYIDLLKKVLLSGQKNKIIKEIFSISKYNKIFIDIKNGRGIKDTIIDTIDYLGEAFNIKIDDIYKINKFNKLILKQVKDLNYLKIDKKLKGKMLISYMYNKFMNTEDKEKIIKEYFNSALLFRKELLATFYLISITTNSPLSLKASNIYNDILNALKGK